MDSENLPGVSPKYSIPVPGIMLTGLFVLSAASFATAPDSLVTAGWFAAVALVLPAAQRAGV
ncbi:hypothetical protein [Novosphingobium aquimarinum]|uniref:hypothetical protein n=1 Tax=Novosphingobium aquimarinum TaxID=2682494 RepID=UPI0012EBFE30|nr:hypothetical protein [Novosphingobium aquimarinum]